MKERSKTLASTVADQEEGPKGPAPPPFIFYTKLKIFWRLPPLISGISEDLDAPLKYVGDVSLGSLSTDVFERRTSTGSGPFSFLDDGFAQIFSQIVSIRVKKLSNANCIASRHITREKSSLPVEVRCSKTSLLKLPKKEEQYPNRSD